MIDEEVFFNVGRRTAKFIDQKKVLQESFFLQGKENSFIKQQSSLRYKGRLPRPALNEATPQCALFFYHSLLKGD